MCAGRDEVSLYQCEKCGGRENTATGHYWVAKRNKEPEICSECHTGQWHNRFPKLMLPIGMFITNQEGNLEHKETGDTDIYKYELIE